jgi:hypothetical protein
MQTDTWVTRGVTYLVEVWKYFKTNPDPNHMTPGSSLFPWIFFISPDLLYFPGSSLFQVTIAVLDSKAILKKLYVCCNATHIFYCGQVGRVIFFYFFENGILYYNKYRDSCMSIWFWNILNFKTVLTIQYMCSSISKDKFIVELKSSVNMLNF